MNCVRPSEEINSLLSINCVFVRKTTVRNNGENDR